MSSSQRAEDKRRSSRTEAPRVVVRIPSVDRFRTHYLKDISEGGLFVKAQKSLPVGATMVLELWPPGWSEPAQLTATVIRSVTPEEASAGGELPGMAVHFVDIAPELEAKLRELIKAHEELPAPADESVGDQIETMVSELEGSREKISLLTNELAEQRGNLEALADQNQRLEALEAEMRALAERLAEEKTVVEQALEAERGRAADEQAKLRTVAKAAEGQIAELVRQLAEAKGQVAATRRQLDEVRGQGDEARREVESARETARIQVERAERLAGELKKRETREQDLRRLLSKVGGPKAALKPSAAAKKVAEDEADDEVVVEEPANGEPIAAAPSGAARPPPPPESSDFDLDLDDLDLGPDKGGKPAAKSEAAVEEEIFSGDVSEDASEDPKESLEAFSASVGPRTRILPADSLAKHHPTTEEGALVVELLGASPTFATLAHQVEEKISEERLRKLLYELATQSLIELR